MKKIQILLAIFFCSALTAFGQTGPAGVGNATGASGQPENIIWLDASTLGLADGASILTWPDLSGNGNDLVQQGADATPLFETNGLFGANHSVARFDGTERYLTLLDNADLDNTLGGITVIGVVFNPILDGSPRAIYSKRNSSGAQQTYSAFTWTSSRLNFDLHNGANRRLASSAALNTTTDYVFTNRYSGTLQETYLQSAASGSTSTSGNVSNTTSNLFLGALNNNYGTYYNGDIAELIFYREGLNDGERLIIENYLSQKYGITITNDFFGTDAGFDATFTNDFMGIGTGDGSTKLSDSGLSDALQIAEVNGSLNSANEFIMMAHDNTAHSDGVTTNLTVDPGVLDSRWARSWFLEATGDVSAELRFDFGTAGLGFSGDASDYVLLYRANTTDDYTRILANSYTVENGDQLVVNLGNISMPSGYYTVGEGTQLVAGNWYSFQSGDWSDPLTWTTISNGSLREPVTGGVPTSGDNVTILSGRTVRMDGDDNDAVTLTVDGRLNLEATSGHNYFSIIGNGVISLEGDGSFDDNFPTGNTSLFADPVVGGTVEILGSGLNLNTTRTYNNMLVSLGNATDVATLLANYTVNGALTISNGILQINDNSATTALSFTANGNVQIDATGELSVGTGNARHEFNFFGDFANQGRAEFTNRVVADFGNEATNGIVDANFLNGSSDQTIDCNGVTNFYRIEIDKGADQTYILDINASSAANFNLFGPADFGHSNTAQLTTNDNNLGLLRGTVRLNTNVDVPVLNNTGNYNISEAARLWVNGGSAEKPGGTAIVPYGTIQVSDGTLDAPINSGITTRDNGNIVIEGGTVTVNQIRTSINGAESLGGYTQSGGTVNITGNNISTNYYAFSLTYPGNTFNMSGGTLNVAGAPTGANTGGIFIASKVSNQSVTGGTVVMEINRNNDFKLTSLTPFWNVIMRYTSGSGSEVDMINGTSGTGGGASTITTPDLRVLNDLTIEDGVTFDHNGFDVEIGSDFTIEATGDYVYDTGKPNTTTINGVDDATLSFLNRSGNISDTQDFWNLIVDKPTDKTVSLASSKTGANLNGNQNLLLHIQGDAFKVLSGTLDQGFHSIRVDTDSLVNYDVMTVFNPANATTAALANGDNDLVIWRPTSFLLITADTSRFGVVRMDANNAIVTVDSDLRVDNLQYRHGRLYLQGNNLTVDRARFSPGTAAEFDFDGSGVVDGDEDQLYNPSDMIVTNGNASDGGLSLLVDGNGTYEFPFGIGTDATDLLRNNSKYTPATVTVSNFSDDGYITIRPVDAALATTEPTGDILSYYWRVDFEDFTANPTVEYQFNYNEDDLDGSGNEATFVAGKVLDGGTFARRFEDDNTTGDPGVVQNEGVNDGTNIITFNGDLDNGFILEAANYTAGESARFVGAPEIFYSRSNNGNWTANNSWSTIGYGGAAGSSTPGPGDIVNIGFSGSPGSYQRHRITLNTGTIASPLEIAELILEQNPEANGVEGNNARLIITPTRGLRVGGTVNGNGEIQYQMTDTDQPTLDADLGGFAETDGASFIMRSNSGDAVAPANLTQFPRLSIPGSSSSYVDGRSVSFAADITCKNLNVRFGGTLLMSTGVAGDIVVEDSLRIGGIGSNNEGRIIYQNSGNARSMTVGGDLIFDADGSIDANQLFVETGGTDNLSHQLNVSGNIEVRDPGALMDLFTADDGQQSNITLNIQGNENTVFNSGATSIPELSRIVIEKESKQNTITVNTDFLLGGSTNGSVKAITLTRGTLALNNSSINIDLTTGGDNYVIPADAGLQITQGTVSVSGNDSGIELDGCVIINGGTLDMDDAVGNGNNYIEYSASGNATLEISSGALNVGSQLRPITSANTGVLKYRQTGGDVRIGTQASPESTRGMLQIYNPNSEFTYTGGTLTIERHQTSPTVAALFLDPAISDVTGSTITIFNANTPAGQTDFRINSTIALDNLTINGTNSPTATLNINTLTINDQLSIASNATLLGDALTLTVGGDFVNDGTYDAEGNETIFNSSTGQEISGGGTNTFFKFTKEDVGILTLTNAIAVADLFTITEGTVDDNGFSINLAADAVVDGTHLSVGGNGLVFAGAANQELRRSASGTGVVGVVSINNSNGVTVPDGNGYNFNINSGLRLEDGLFNVGGASILLGTNAEITPVNPFSVTNMIQTNSSFVDSGIGKQFAANYSTDFTFPVGQAFYTPVSFDFGTGGNTFGTTAGTLTVRPANEFHPTVNDGIVDAALGGTGDINNVLQYYWTVEASGVTGMNVDMTLSYDQSHVLVDAPAFDESDYIAARILSVANPTFLINKFTTTEVDETTNIITFNFSAADQNGITGDYFAGIDEAIPDNVATYTVDVDGGNVGDDVYVETVPGGGAPTGAVVIVPNGLTLSLDQDDVRFYATEIQDGGTLEVDNTTNHRLGELTGTGTLRIVSDGINANLPAFSGDFLSCTGGGLEYAGTGSYSVLSGITTVRNLTFSGSGLKSMANNNLTVCNDLVIDGATFRGNLGNSITVNNDFIIQNGEYRHPSGSAGILTIDNNLIVNGGVFSGGVSSGRVIINNQLTISGGDFIVGGNSHRTFLLGDLSFTSGTFDGGSANSKFIFSGNNVQNISGNFTGSDDFYNFEIQNISGVNILSGGVEISNVLTLTSGIITTNGNLMELLDNASVSPSTGAFNSYVNGNLSKTLNNAGSSFTFPIGSATLWRPATINNVSDGGLTWSAEYFQANATINDPLVDNNTPTDDVQIATVSGFEYWKISDDAGTAPPLGVTATVGLSWGFESDVSAISAEREELEVMIWNDAISSWDNLGGTSFSGGHTQSAGNFVATSTNSFSEQIFTLGSGDASNALPITLKSFEGYVENGRHYLEWVTSSEINNDRFELERSIDGVTFEKIADIEGAGTSIEELKYQYVDTSPFFGKNYYRLKQIDIDGTLSYADRIVLLENDNKFDKLAYKLYPNPTDRSNINLEIASPDLERDISISVYDAFGRKYYAKTVNANSLNQPLSIVMDRDAKSGLYLVIVEQGDERIQKRLIVY